MTRRPGDHDHASGPEDAFWWLDDDASQASRPSDTRLSLERLRRDVHEAPDLSARILGQAGRHDVFVPRGRRRAIRAMRWGGACAAALLLGVTLYAIHRTPAGASLRTPGPTPVADLVTDLSSDAARVAHNVRAIPDRLASADRFVTTPAADASSDAPALTARPTAATSLRFVMEQAPPFASREASAVGDVEGDAETGAPAAMLGVGSFARAIDAMAVLLEPGAPAFRTLSAQGVRVPAGEFPPVEPRDFAAQRAGFFAGEPEPR